MVLTPLQRFISPPQSRHRYVSLSCHPKTTATGHLGSLATFSEYVSPSGKNHDAE
ncbi:hypothetical protein KIN20_019327 [Parelaphostrongylus tenuis]|uniref:Uncharacterized protein n=1 Tax=Parelaphostrongylus tenuis TaxID=148309 RepID=A0AAD5N8L4_PARTN|nr:hypothetical protein KIN20_019327 [Parelaphostrongylus tenuis]